MTTTQFLLCLHRFIARRGVPALILSDNTKLFHLAATVLERMWQDTCEGTAVQEFVAQRGITWRFIVEHTPWQRGMYERLVGTVKRTLRKVLGKLLLYPDQLTTVLAEVEAVVNSSPLAYVGADPHDHFVLTPAHFLIGQALTTIQNALPDNFDEYQPSSVLGSADTLLAAWKKGQAHLNTFWKVWSRDYLLNLRERST